MHDVQAFLRDRQRGVGGSDIPALIPDCPSYGTPLSVYLDKVCEPTQQEAEHLEEGQVLEDGIRKLYARRMGYGELAVTVPQQMRNPACQWEVAHLDGLTNTPSGNRRVLEIKTTTVKKEYQWGEAGTHDCREDAYYQAQWGLHVAEQATGEPIECVDVVAYFRDAYQNRLRIYPSIPRDQQTIDALRKVAEKFWTGHVIPKQPPPPTDPVVDAPILAKLWGKSEDDIAADFDDDHFALVQQYAHLRKEISELKRVQDAVAMVLRQVMGPATLAENDTYKVTHRSRATVKWAKVAEELKARLKSELGDDAVEQAWQTAIKGYTNHTRALLIKEK